MMPTPAQVVGFADGLLKLKHMEAAGKGTELTADEVSGLLWAIKQLRGGLTHGSADDAADRDRAEAGGG